MTTRAPCVRCGMLLHTGEGKITVAFTPQELIDLAWAAFNLDRLDPVISVLLCAAGLLDEAKERETRADMERCKQ